jgi:hypothetical protein
MEFYDKMLAVQTELKAPKDKYNSFGKYSYRSAEGILEAVKPLLRKYGLLMVLQDEIVEIGGRVFCKAMAKITDAEVETIPNSLQTQAFAEIPTEKKGMDPSQITGTASSYARKYALNGMFLIDDNKDADTDEFTQESQAKAKKGNDIPAYIQRLLLEALMNSLVRQYSSTALVISCTATHQAHVS